jgi:hypothetical protein
LRYCISGMLHFYLLYNHNSAGAKGINLFIAVWSCLPRFLHLILKWNFWYECA